MSTGSIKQGAKTIRCKGCGSSFEIPSLSEAVTCSHCGKEQLVDEQLLEDLRRYEAAVGDDLEQARMARVQAAVWESTSNQVKKSTRIGSYLLALGVMVGLPMATFSVGMLLMNQGVIPKGRVDIIGIATQVSAFLGIGAYYAIYVFRRKQLKIKDTRLDSSKMRCPDCGASNEILTGEVLETCHYCGASLMPTESVRHKAVDAASRERRRALMEKYRAERSGYAVYRKVGLSSTATTIYIGGSFLLMIGGGTIAFSVQMATGSEPYNPAIFGMWAATIAIVAGMIGVIKFKRWKARTFAVAVRSLAESFGGELLNGADGTTVWLNDFWAGPIDPLEMFPGKYYQSAAISIRGYQVFLDVNSIPMSDQHRVYSRIIVPCNTKEPLGNISAEAQALIDRCSSLGYLPLIQPGGLIARADQDIIKQLRKPEHVSQMAEPITAMVKLAEGLNAKPCGPVPN